MFLSARTYRGTRLWHYQCCLSVPAIPCLGGSSAACLENQHWLCFATLDKEKHDLSLHLCVMLCFATLDKLKHVRFATLVTKICCSENI